MYALLCLVEFAADVLQYRQSFVETGNAALVYALVTPGVLVHLLALFICMSEELK